MLSGQMLLEPLLPAHLPQPRGHLPHLLPNHPEVLYLQSEVCQLVAGMGIRATVADDYLRAELLSHRPDDFLEMTVDVSVRSGNLMAAGMAGDTGVGAKR